MTNFYCSNRGDEPILFVTVSNVMKVIMGTHQ